MAAASAALAVLLTASAFAGVLGDFRWLAPTVLTTAAVTATGIGARSRGWWPPLVVLAQLAAGFVMLVALFCDQAFLGFLPTPAALSEFGGVLSRAVDTVQHGVPPVPAAAPLQCLVALGIGVVAVLVDVLVVLVGVPAVAGLVLLCVFAIPVSLDEQLLPWWTFVLSAGGFALLLTTGGQQRHVRWRGRDGALTAGTRLGLGQPSLAVVGVASVAALLAGTAFTGIGTEGRLPGHLSDSRGTTDGIGVKPFTSLRGQLDRDRPIELFRVSGLPKGAYLRAMTLRKFDPNRGWDLDVLTQGFPADQPLPPAEGTSIQTGPVAHVRVDEVGYRDPWLPTYGMPLRVAGIEPGWRYDPASGILFAQTQQSINHYTEDVRFPDPTPDQLRAARGPFDIHPVYLDTTGIPPEVSDLAERITATAPTAFDKAAALDRFFTDPANGFRYTLNTAPESSSNALVDFLLHGKQGYCEQYASAMAVMLRAVGVPSRVAVGFTSGHPNGDQRVITTEDAHAWVEAYFPGYGWTTFDPTPLADGRTVVPDYLGGAGQLPLPAPAPPAPPAAAGTPSPGQAQAPASRPGTGPLPAAQPPAIGGTSFSAALGVGVSALGLAVVLLLLPLSLRELRRRRRLQAVGVGSAAAVSSAWREVLDQSWDRGTQPEAVDTARAAGQRLVRHHGLGEDGARAMRRLVAAVEREWYAGTGAAGGSNSRELAEVLNALLDSFRQDAPLSWHRRLFPRSVLTPRSTKD